MPQLALRDWGIFFARPLFWLAAALALATVVYLPGLDGPFVFDDTPNLRPLAAWLSGKTGWEEALLGNRSGFLGRPLSMLTFVINAKLFGLTSYSFKLTNLIIHLICGGLIYALLRLLLLRDARLDRHAVWLPLLVSTVWLLHPMQVSTVLYVVQRMAQLSTLFVLVGLLAYVQGRLALERGRHRAGMIWLFLAVPFATITAILCKENGALTPLLCAVIEFGYFRSTPQTPRPLAVKNFFLLGLVLPALAVSVWYLWPPSRLLASYSVRTFTLGERLLSEPRALFDYIGALLMPRGPALGVYTDGFAVSHGLLQPASTLFGLIGMIALVTLAVISRRRVPAVFTGIGFYLAGHAMESSVFPLELYFEHRNYLPSVGLFLAVAGGVEWLLGKLPVARGSSRPRLLAVGAVALCAFLAIATAARAWAWQSWSTLVEQGVNEHPESGRAQFDNLGVVWAQGVPQETRRLLDELATANDPVFQHLAAVYRVMFQCQQGEAPEAESLARVAAIAGSKLQLGEMEAFEHLAVYLRTHDCAGLSKIQLADMLRKIVDAAPQPQSNMAIWRTRFTIATLYDFGEQPNEARAQAQKAWDTGVADTAVGVILLRLQFYNGDVAGARITREQLRGRIASWDRRNQEALDRIDKELLPP